MSATRTIVLSALTVAVGVLGGCGSADFKSCQQLLASRWFPSEAPLGSLPLW
jgi:hypothetical protein